MIDPIAQKAGDAFANDRRTMELVEDLAPEQAEGMRNLWLNGDPPPITAEEHALFLSLSVRALAEKATEQAEELAEQGRRLADLEAV